MNRNRMGLNFSAINLRSTQIRQKNKQLLTFLPVVEVLGPRATQGGCLGLGAQL